MKLSQAAFERAGNYLKEFGRPLEVARFAYHFEGGPEQRIRKLKSWLKNGGISNSRLYYYVKLFG